MPAKYAMFLLIIAILLIFGSPFLFRMDKSLTGTVQNNTGQVDDYASANLSLHFDQLLKDDNLTVLSEQGTKIIDRELYLIVIDINDSEQFNNLQLQIALLGFEAELLVDSVKDSTSVRVGPFKSSSERNNFRQHLLKIGIESTIY